MIKYDEVDFFTEQSLIEDPFPYLEHLRSRCPVVRLPHHNVVAVTGYDEANEVWRDPDTFSSCNSVSGPFPGFPVDLQGEDVSDLIRQHRAGLPMADYIVTQDEPEHTAMRGLLMRLLTPSRLRENQAFIEQLAQRQVDEAVAKQTFEVLSDLAQPFAAVVIADLLGVPEEDHQEFASQLGVYQPGPGVGDETTQGTHDPLAFLFRKFTEYIEDRRREPRTDVLTRLANATYQDGTTPGLDDVVRTACFLFAAGQDTTAKLVTVTLKYLSQDPDLQTRVRTDPQRIPDLIEEVLRLEGSVKAVGRLARTDTSLAGVDIAAGTNVVIFPHAANRDPAVFPDPTRLDLDRPNARTHVAFGRGIHSCPGGPLARIEARILIDCLLAATTEIRLSDVHGPAGEEQFDYEPTYVVRGLRALHLDVVTARVPA